MDIQEIVITDLDDAERLLTEFRQAIEASTVYTPDIHRTSARLAYRVGIILGHVARWELMDNGYRRSSV